MGRGLGVVGKGHQSHVGDEPWAGRTARRCLERQNHLKPRNIGVDRRRYQADRPTPKRELLDLPSCSSRRRRARLHHAGGRRGQRQMACHSSVGASRRAFFGAPPEAWREDVCAPSRPELERHTWACCRSFAWRPPAGPLVLLRACYFRADCPLQQQPQQRWQR